MPPWRLKQNTAVILRNRYFSINYCYLCYYSEKNPSPSGNRSNPRPSRYRQDALTTELCGDSHRRAGRSFWGKPHDFTSREYAGLKQCNTLTYFTSRKHLRKVLCTLWSQPTTDVSTTELVNILIIIIIILLISIFNYYH